jgi:hypothetical protein
MISNFVSLRTQQNVRQNSVPGQWTGFESQSDHLSAWEEGKILHFWFAHAESADVRVCRGVRTIREEGLSELSDFTCFSQSRVMAFFTRTRPFEVSHTGFQISCWQTYDLTSTPSFTLWAFRSHRKLKFFLKIDQATTEHPLALPDRNRSRRRMSKVSQVERRWGFKYSNGTGNWVQRKWSKCGSQ